MGSPPRAGSNASRRCPNAHPLPSLVSHAHRWELPAHLLDLLVEVQAGDPDSPGNVGDASAEAAAALMPVERELLGRLRRVVAAGLAAKQLQRVPHLVLLSAGFYHATLRPLLAEWLLLWLRRQGLRDVSDAKILACLSAGGADAEAEAVLPDAQVRMLNLGFDWLHSLLPHTLSKVDRVHYGLLRPHELEAMQRLGTLPRSRRLLAVPFLGKDAPSPSSEYAHPDVAIGLATLAYRYEGLRRADFGAALAHLRGEYEAEHGSELQRPAALAWIRWVHSAAGGRRVRGTAGARHASAAAARAARLATAAQGMDALLCADGGAAQSDILPLHLLELSDVEYMELLYQLLGHSGEVIRYYLHQLVFPETTAHQATKLSANGQDLGGEMLFGTRIGFSGTPSSLLPLEMGECVYQRGDDGRMLAALTDPSTVSKVRLPADWSVTSLLAAATSLSPTPHALIDAGALITGMSNAEAATALLDALPPSHFDGVVFLESGGVKRILLRGAAEAVDLERCAHCTSPPPLYSPRPLPSTPLPSAPLHSPRAAVRHERCGRPEG